MSLRKKDSTRVLKIDNHFCFKIVAKLKKHLIEGWFYIIF